LAGAMHAIELLKVMREEHVREPLGKFAGRMLLEVEKDRDVLTKVAERTGAIAGGLKEWGAFLAEKVSRLKLKRSSAESLGTFEALEFLVLGIHGKWALWRALSAIATLDPRLRHIDFNELIIRAERQHAQVDNQRLALARIALSSTKHNSPSRLRNRRTKDSTLLRSNARNGRSIKALIAMRDVVGTVGLIYAGYVLVMSVPDFRRYVKISTM
jgi:hypothetical protein